METKKNTRKIGNIGENIACKYLKRKDFEIIERNYLRKWGELDIVARGTDQKVHFIEVKAVSHETRADLKQAVTRGTWRPEEQVHQFKLHQIAKAIETWLAENDYNGDWQLDIIAIRMVPREKYATVKMIENIVD